MCLEREHRLACVLGLTVGDKVVAQASAVFAVPH